jgi:hypothetical protein
VIPASSLAKRYNKHSTILVFIKGQLFFPKKKDDLLKKDEIVPEGGKFV